MQLSRAERATLAAVQAGLVKGSSLSDMSMPAELILDGVSARTVFGLMVAGLAHIEGSQLRLTEAGQRALLSSEAAQAG